MKNVFTLTFILLVSLISQHVEAQFGGIMNSAKRKLEQKIADKVVDAVSEEIARRAFKPIEVAIDSMMRERYQDSIGKGEKVDWDKVGTSYADFINNMNKAVELPEKYQFDVSQVVETKDYDNEKRTITLHYSKTASLLAMETTDDKQTTQIVVMDVEKDAIIMFTTDKKGKKTGQAIPNVMKFASSLAKSSSTTDSKDKFSINKTGKTKKIAGLLSDEYKGESEKENVNMYVSQTFPIDLRNSFSGFVKQFAPASYNENMTGVSNGVMMEYTNSLKEDKNKKTEWKTTKINEKGFDIVTSNYAFEVKK